LVGGLAECPLVQAAMKRNFPNKRIIIPEEAGLSVLFDLVRVCRDQTM
jgi:hypothetical protein